MSRDLIIVIGTRVHAIRRAEVEAFVLHRTASADHAYFFGARGPMGIMTPKGQGPWLERLREDLTEGR